MIPKFLLQSISIPVFSSTPGQPSPLTLTETRPKSLVAELLEDLFPSILLAVPKKKVSHSRKSMRSAHKGLKDKTNIVACPACGQPKLSHNLCPTCYSQLSRARKRDVAAGEQ
ncbi:uncharacterized protein EI90DRAFT_2918299 [Cantharellus anzutake]|uniref:uncharacterized protein n=1 Tax=Cantharellus anzutake TaxID=1750568 RepID=UPI0019064FA5|nr:uncharacterized protein EI90DRAFT_2918299 [Cantharellus anzutake]KAF8332352.1 hypothetical protein EI90DRAFT_2918299 [Cantharellus anzutake]